MVLLDKNQIKELIPHREPFLLIDEITSLTPGEKCTARAYIKETDFWVPGHFPGYPVTPGVLIIEMLAQTGAVCIASKAEFKGKVALFSKIDKVKFRHQVVLGDVLELEISLVRLRSRVGVGRAEAKVNGKTACSCELTFMFDKSIAITDIGESQGIAGDAAVEENFTSNISQEINTAGEEGGNIEIPDIVGEDNNIIG